ncbi:hypothetical protein [Pontibacter burrus]|uniref:Uncharacterized protein n=1 Tax=Pontibacter burrus TaxID=2704466 RepID=A0A6B3LWL3_9BACT|nr:hypothetical protein [Pontibacter burrus]NEM99335.1 hypothetical protein [Pontibacter burrus]
MIRKKEFVHFLSVFESGEMGLEIGDIHLYYHVNENELQVISEFKVSLFYDKYYNDSVSELTMNLVSGTTEFKEMLALFQIS